jgi:hypothetical protein
VRHDVALRPLVKSQHQPSLDRCLKPVQDLPSLCGVGWSWPGDWHSSSVCGGPTAALSLSSVELSALDGFRFARLTAHVHSGRIPGSLPPLMLFWQQRPVLFRPSGPHQAGHLTCDSGFELRSKCVRASFAFRHRLVLVDRPSERLCVRVVQCRRFRLRRVWQMLQTGPYLLHSDTVVRTAAQRRLLVLVLGTPACPQC